MTSAIARLRELPEAFTFAGFCKLTRLSNGAAAVWLARWKEKGLIEPAGERARLYFNKLKCSEVDGSLRVAALLFEYPSAVLSGESVLHAAGWITQIPASLSVAVLSRPSYVSLHGFDIRGRTLSWFKKVHSALDPAPDKQIYGLRALPAPLALADLYGDSKGWHPDVDDLDIPQEELASVATAAMVLGVDLPAPLVHQIAGS
ncbi:MAG: hypothetical protein WBE92_18935 [Steroidobacteraceae bacterium]